MHLSYTYLTITETHNALEFRVTLILLSNNFELYPFTNKVCIIFQYFSKVFIGRYFYAKKSWIEKKIHLVIRMKKTSQSLKVAYFI